MPDEKPDDALLAAARAVLSAYRSRLPEIMAGLGDRPGPGKKARAREALKEHMQDMHALAGAIRNHTRSDWAIQGSRSD